MATLPETNVRRSSRYNCGQYNKTRYRDDYQIQTAGLAKGTRRKHSSTVTDGDEVVTGESQKTDISDDTDEEISPTKCQQGSFQTAREMMMNMNTNTNNRKNKNGKETARAIVLLDDEFLNLTPSQLKTPKQIKTANVTTEYHDSDEVMEAIEFRLQLGVLPSTGIIQQYLIHFHGKFEINQLQLSRLRERMYQMLMKLLDIKYTPNSKNKMPILSPKATAVIDNATLCAMVTEVLTSSVIPSPRQDYRSIEKSQRTG